jgi:para-nitrobenzyl esterase
MDARVETTLGTLEGQTRSDHLRFLGVPFAAPPIAGLRYLPPAPLAPWPGVREAKQSAVQRRSRRRA